MTTMRSENRFENKVAFITGAAVGFGHAFAEALAAEGAAIVIADIDGDAGEGAAKELAASGYQALAVTCDVADEGQVQAAVEAGVEHFGGIDVLINNAGKHLMKYNQPFGTLGMDEVHALFDVNVMGVIAGTLAANRRWRRVAAGACSTSRRSPATCPRRPTACRSSR